jgi:hypothetical protein
VRSGDDPQSRGRMAVLFQDFKFNHGPAGLEAEAKVFLSRSLDRANERSVG